MFVQNKIIESKKQSSDFKLMAISTPHLEIGLDDVEVFSVDQADNIRMHLKENTCVISQFSAKSKKNSINVIAFNPKYKILFVGREDGSIDYYKPSSKQKNKQTIKPHFSSVNHISFSSDFKKMITSSNDKKIKIFDIQKVQNKIKIKFLLTLNSHTSFVLKSLFSDDISCVYSIDQNTLRSTKVTSTIVHGQQNNLEITNVINNKEEIMAYKTQKNIIDFYKVNEYTLLICYQDCSFELLNLKDQMVVKQFQLGENFQLQKCSYAQETFELLINFLDDKQSQKVLILDAFQLDQQTFQINNNKNIQDILFSIKGNYFMMLVGRQIITFQNTKILRKKPHKKKAVKQAQIQTNINQENKDQNIQQQVQSEQKIQMLQQLGQFSLALQKITDGFQQLDKKLTQNEQRTQTLMKKFQQKQNLKQSHLSDNQLCESQSLDKEIQENDPIQNFQNYQLKYNALTLEETEKRLKQTLQTESNYDQAQQEIVDKNFSLEKVQKFISERDNFSFKRDKEISDNDNIFDDVIGKTLHEKTVTFQTEENPSNMLESFRITNTDKNIIFNTFDRQEISPDQLRYTTHHNQIIEQVNFQLH